MSQLNLLKAGDYVTVLEWVNSRDRSYTRHCLKVLVIDAPLVRLQPVSEYKHERDRIITLNENDVVFKKLSDEYVQSILSQIK